MDLMSVTAGYKDLSNKYDHFRAPAVEISAGGVRLAAASRLQITEIEVDLTCGYEASGCVFFIDGEYEPKQSDFSSAIGKIQIGETVEVELGYIRKEKIFCGYINQIGYEFGMDGDAWRIRVECLDAKGLLMKNRRMEFFKEKSADGVVKAVLGQQPVSSYLSGKEIDPCEAEETALRANMMTDYDVVIEQANKQGYEFFILQGKAYFRKKEKIGSPVLKLTPKHGILSASLKLSGQLLCKTAEIRSIDQESAKLLTGEANITGTFSEGGSAARMMGNSRQIYYEPGVRDAKEAKKRAENRMEKAAESFGTLECECIGIPEIGPGRFIEIEGLAKAADRKYYIVEVRHRMDADGYKTSFKARVKSL